jgi:hypothetical protein
MGMGESVLNLDPPPEKFLKLDPLKFWWPTKMSKMKLGKTAENGNLANTPKSRIFFGS